MLGEDRTWYKLPGASQAALGKLRALTGTSAPSEYFELLAFSNGGEGPLDVQPFNFCLDSAETVASNIDSGCYDSYFPGYLMIGGDGGGDLIAFDTNADAAWRVVSIDATNINLNESVILITKDFASFLKHVGLEEDDA